MTLQTSGAISLNDLATEFGGAQPHSLSEYYAGGGLVPAGASGTNGTVPSSGAISLSNFYGVSNYADFALTLQYNLTGTESNVYPVLGVLYQPNTNGLLFRNGVYSTTNYASAHVFTQADQYGNKQGATKRYYAYLSTGNPAPAPIEIKRSGWLVSPAGSLGSVFLGQEYTFHYWYNTGSQPYMVSLRRGPATSYSANVYLGSHDLGFVGVARGSNAQEQFVTTIAAFGTGAGLYYYTGIVRNRHLGILTAMTYNGLNSITACLEGNTLTIAETSGEESATYEKRIVIYTSTIYEGTVLDNLGNSLPARLATTPLYFSYYGSPGSTIYDVPYIYNVKRNGSNVYLLWALNGSANLYISKINVIDGSQWYFPSTIKINITARVNLAGLDIDSSGNLYCFSNSYDSQYASRGIGPYSTSLLKFDSNLNQIWHRSLFTTWNNYLDAVSITADTNDSSYYVSFGINGQPNAVLKLPKDGSKTNDSNALTINFSNNTTQNMYYSSSIFPDISVTTYSDFVPNSNGSATDGARINADSDNDTTGFYFVESPSTLGTSFIKTAI